MKLEINPRGNGACPLCRHCEDCRLKATLSLSMNQLNDPEAEMEIVVYSCPDFSEQA